MHIYSYNFCNNMQVKKSLKDPDFRVLKPRNAESGGDFVLYEIRTNLSSKAQDPEN